jgi:hypothetical protein
MDKTRIGDDQMTEFYIDARTTGITTSNPIQGDDDDRQIVDIQVYEGMSIFEAKGVLEGWLASFRGTEEETRRTVARIRIG